MKMRIILDYYKMLLHEYTDMTTNYKYWNNCYIHDHHSQFPL